MQKEIITKKIIKHDCETIILKDIATIFGITIFFSSLLAFVGYAMHLTSFILVFKLIVTAPFAFFVFIFLWMLYDLIKKFYLIHSDKFYIVTDKMVGCKAKRIRPYTILSKSQSIPFTLIFDSYGKYGISEHKNYSWSKRNALKDEDVFNCSDIGDEFYLVIMKINKKEEIAMAYNSKLFQFEE